MPSITGATQDWILIEATLGSPNSYFATIRSTWDTKSNMYNEKGCSNHDFSKFGLHLLFGTPFMDQNARLTFSQRHLTSINDFRITYQNCKVLQYKEHYYSKKGCRQELHLNRKYKKDRMDTDQKRNK